MKNFAIVTGIVVVSFVFAFATRNVPNEIISHSLSSMILLMIAKGQLIK